MSTYRKRQPHTYERMQQLAQDAAISWLAGNYDEVSNWIGNSQLKLLFVFEQLQLIDQDEQGAYHFKHAPTFMAHMLKCRSAWRPFKPADPVRDNPSH